MEKEEILCYIAFAILFFIIGIILGCSTCDYSIMQSGISETSYCKEIQIDTLQYDYKQDMYKFEIKIIK